MSARGVRDEQVGGFRLLGRGFRTAVSLAIF